MQAVGLLLPDDLRLRTKQADTLNCPAVQAAASQTANCHFAIRRPTEFDGVERRVLDCEAKVFRRVGLRIGIVKGSARGHGWAFAILLPGARSVNRFAIHLEPRADFAQNLLLLPGNGAVGPRGDIQQQVSVLADHIGQQMDDELRGLVGVVGKISPGRVADGSIGLPVALLNVGQLAAFHVERGGVLLGCQADLRSPFDEYKAGRVQFLCACDLLTEGWDSPQTSVLVMARPTMSKVLYVQQLGRGTRSHPGKEALYVLDVVDRHGPLNAP